MSITRTTLDMPVRIGRRLAAHPLKTGGAVLAADLLSKSAASTLPLKAQYCLASSSICVQHLQNENGTFGAHYEWGMTSKLLMAGSVLSMAAIFVKAKSQINKLALALAIGGSASNLFERFAWGHVTDFIRCGPWYVFNLADASLTASCLLIVYEAVAGLKRNMRRDPSSS